MYEYNLARTDILDNFEEVFKDYDLIISPVMCTLPIKNEANGNTKGPKTINGKPVESLVGWCETFLVNFVSYPAISIPSGLINGLPVGMQIIGKKFNEATVLKCAKAYEKIEPWNKWYDIPFNIH